MDAPREPGWTELGWVGEGRYGCGVRSAIPLRKWSYMSLAVKTESRTREFLSNATAFHVTYDSATYLITNWHVVAGRDSDDGTMLPEDAGAYPDILRSLQVVENSDIRWEWVGDALYDVDGEPRWYEHPVHGRRVDVVALPTTCPDGYEQHPYDAADPGPPIAYGPSDRVSVIGFPFGESGGGALGLWIQGTVASEPWIDYHDLPCLLIDSRTRNGQSGSPVIVYRSDGYRTVTGNFIDNGIPGCLFVGVYSGRINEQSDLGFVWKSQALVEILEAKTRGTIPKLGSPP